MNGKERLLQMEADIARETPSICIFLFQFHKKRKTDEKYKDRSFLASKKKKRVIRKRSTVLKFDSFLAILSGKAKKKAARRAAMRASEQR